VSLLAYKSAHPVLPSICLVSAVLAIASERLSCQGSDRLSFESYERALLTYSQMLLRQQPTKLWRPSERWLGGLQYGVCWKQQLPLRWTKPYERLHLQCHRSALGIEYGVGRRRRRRWCNTDTYAIEWCQRIRYSPLDVPRLLRRACCWPCTKLPEP